MKLLNYTFLACMLSLLPFQSQAQILKSLGKAVNDAVKDKTVKKAADVISEEIVDAIPVENEEQDGDENRDTINPPPTTKLPTQADYPDFMAGMLKDAKSEASYTFDLSIKMEIIDHKDKDHDMIIDQAYGKEAMLTITEDNKIIIDFKNESSIIILEKENEARVMSLSFMQQSGQYHTPDTDSHYIPKITKTGNTKMIAKRKAEEYKIEYEDGYALIWSTNDIDFNYETQMMSFTQIFKKMSWSSDALKNGFILEMNSFDEKGKAESTMRVLEINQKPMTIDLSKYERKSIMDR